MKKNLKVLCAAALVMATTTVGTVRPVLADSNDIYVTVDDGSSSSISGDLDFEEEVSTVVPVPDPAPVVPDPKPTVPTEPTVPDDTTGGGITTGDSIEDTKPAVQKTVVTLDNVDFKADVYGQINDAKTLDIAECNGTGTVINKFTVSKTGTVGIAFYTGSGNGVKYKLRKGDSIVKSNLLGDAKYCVANLKKGTYFLETEYEDSIEIKGCYFRNKSNVKVGKYKANKKKTTAEISLVFKKNSMGYGARFMVVSGKYDPAADWKTPNGAKTFKVLKKNAKVDKAITKTKMPIKLSKNGKYAIVVYKSLGDGNYVRTVHNVKLSGLKK